MARSKAPRKRKPGKSGKPSVARITPPSYPKRFMVTLPPDTDGCEPDEFFYDTPAEAIQHCVRLGPQFFLDTQLYPPQVTITRGFEQHPGEADEAGYDSIEGAMTESMPLDEFMTCTELEIIPVSFDPWGKFTDNWTNLATFFAYPADIRKVIYTTNAIESLNSVIRHAIKKRKVFPTDDAVKKVVWLAIQAASQKWTMPLRDWRMAMSRFIIEFGDRLDGHF